MRHSTLLILIVTQIGLVACDRGVRKYDPLHRAPAPGQTDGDSSPEAKNSDGETKSPDKTAPAPTPGAPGTAESISTNPKEIGGSLPITSRRWCVVHKDESSKGYVVDRYAFSPDQSRATTVERLSFVAKQIPLPPTAQALPRWTEVSNGNTHADQSSVGVELLTSDVAQASPAFEDQGALFDQMIKEIHVDVSPDSLGEDGAVRLSVPGRPEAIAFDCQNYSSTFVSFGRSAAPAAAPTTTPDPAARGTAAALRGPLAAVSVEQLAIGNSRWCSYTKIRDDVIVGLLQFGLKKDVSLSHLRSSMLKGAAPGKKGFAKASLHAPDEDVLTGAKASSFVTKNGRAYRFVRDADGTRAIIFDSAQGNAPPMTIAEVFFECDPKHDPIQDAAVTQNLTDYMNFRAAKK